MPSESFILLYSLFSSYIEQAYPNIEHICLIPSIRFNDVENTEIYLIDIRKISKQLILSKGYVIDITTYTTDDGERLQTLRYIRKSEMNKDFEALIYKLDEYGIKYKKQIKFD